MLVYYGIFSLLTAIISLALGIFVYSRGRKRAVNVTCALLNLSVAIWSFSTFMMMLAGTKGNGLFWCRALHGGAILIPGVFLHFVLALLEDIKKKILFFVYTVTGVILGLDFTSWIIKDAL
ncbi:hypothetical protein MUO65_02815, partial [bacterium]|nr:hypothetical protein [bacterium]